jgi:hypothetical protein
MMCPSPAGQVAPLLVSMMLGYGVLLLARREGRLLSRVGKFIGWLVILVSLSGLLCKAVHCMRMMCPSKGMKPAVMCPYGGPKSDLMPPQSGEGPTERG